MLFLEIKTNLDLKSINQHIETWDNKGLNGLLEAGSIEIKDLKNASYLFSKSANSIPDLAFNIDMPKLETANSMFEDSTIKEFHAQIPLLNENRLMFGMSDLELFTSPLQSLTTGNQTFYGTQLKSFDIDMPNIIETYEMFAHSKIESFTSNVNKLSSETDMFIGTKLENTNIKITQERPLKEREPLLELDIDIHTSKTFDFLNKKSINIDEAFQKLPIEEQKKIQENISRASSKNHDGMNGLKSSILSAHEKHKQDPSVSTHEHVMNDLDNKSNVVFDVSAEQAINDRIKAKIAKMEQSKTKSKTPDDKKPK
jgi:hypothetical protein